jgi:hypothetical protein
MFVSNPIIPATATISASPELSNITWEPNYSSFNSGVIAINVPFFLSIKQEFIEFCRENGFYSPLHNSYDQVLLNRYFAGRWERLPAEMNWRPVQGVNEAAEIVHFHGPKPHRAKAIMEGKEIPGESGLRQMIEFSPYAYDAYIRRFYETLSRAPLFS